MCCFRRLDEYTTGNASDVVCNIPVQRGRRMPDTQQLQCQGRDRTQPASH